MTEGKIGQRRLKILVYKPAPPRQSIRVDRLLCCEPLELEYLHGALADRHDLIVLDAAWDRTEPIRLVARQRVEVVLVTAYITNVNTVLQLAARLKGLPTPPLVFVGGPHAEVLPESFYTENIDGVFFANQLDGLARALDHIGSNQDYSGIPGAAFSIGGEFKRNPPVPLDVHGLPKPSRYLFARSRKRYRYMYRRPCASIKTAFGCGQSCMYCFCREMNGRAYSCRRIDDVVDEIEQIEANDILILDDNFLSSRKRLAEFCDEIARRAIKKDFVAYGASHFIARNPDMMQRLRQAGLTGIMVGLEFVTDADLKAYHKVSTVHDNDKTIDICHELGIELFGLFMVDPDWRHQDFWNLAKYLKEHDIFFAAFSTLTTLPGTELARRQGAAQTVDTRMWRYDLLRLHQTPRYMSPLLYYLWLFYLYMLPGLRIKGVDHLRSKYGSLALLEQMACGLVAGLEYGIKLLIWR